MSVTHLGSFGLAGRWFKGNLHTHTTQSDGLFTPGQAIDWYRDHGYDFLALSDHWVLTPGRVIDDDFITIAAAELNGAGYHMLALGLDALPNGEYADDAQEMADQVRSAGGLPFIAHPYWTGQTSAEIAAIDGLAGIEAYNAVCQIECGLGHARVHWDELLQRGARLTGLATDDVHWKHGAAGTAYIVARCQALTEDSILDAIIKGHFYASTGPSIHDLSLVEEGQGPRLRIDCSPCRRITYYASGPRGTRFEVAEGESLKSAAYRVKPEQGYLRVECEDAVGDIAWTNPVYVDDML